MRGFKVIIILLIFGFIISFQTRSIYAQVEFGAEEKILSPQFKITKTGGFNPQEVIVKFKPWFGKDFGEKLFEFVGVKHKKLQAEVDFSILELPSQKDVLSEVKFLSSLPFVEYAEPNYIVRAFFMPNDPYYPYQWNFKNINLEEAWEISQGKDVVVAVIDTGIAYENYSRYYLAPDFKGTNFVAGYDFVSGDTHANDDNGHGTHVAGTIAQTTNNGEGVAGVAFKAKLMPIKVLDKYGRGTIDQVAQGIRWAADHQAQVINLSLGLKDKSNTLEEALAYASQKGVVSVAAVGNDSRGEVYFPAAYDDYVIAVGATRYDNTKASYSNWGSSLDLVAPGGDLSQDQNKDGYGDGILQQTLKQGWFGADTRKFNYYFYQGTSMAAPHVSGVAALLIASGINTPDLVRQVLEATALDLGEKGWDLEYGWGLINAKAALEYQVGQGQEEESPPEEVIEEPEPEPEPNQPPKAVVGEDKNVFVGDEVLFDGSASQDPDGEIVEYNWDFGDDSTFKGINVTHIYNQAGSYQVVLTVTDNEGATSQDTLEVRVEEKLPPSPTVDSLDVSLKTTDEQKQEKSSFSRWENIGVLVSVSSDGNSVAGAEVKLELFNSWGWKRAESAGQTDNKGEFFTLFSRQSFTGDYKIKATVSYENLKETREISFTIRWR